MKNVRRFGKRGAATQGRPGSVQMNTLPARPAPCKLISPRKLSPSAGHVWSLAGNFPGYFFQAPFSRRLTTVARPPTPGGQGALITIKIAGRDVLLHEILPPRQNEGERPASAGPVARTPPAGLHQRSAPPGHAGGPPAGGVRRPRPGRRRRAERGPGHRRAGRWAATDWP